VSDAPQGAERADVPVDVTALIIPDGLDEGVESWKVLDLYDVAMAVRLASSLLSQRCQAVSMPATCQKDREINCAMAKAYGMLADVEFILGDLSEGDPRTFRFAPSSRLLKEACKVPSVPHGTSAVSVN